MINLKNKSIVVTGGTRGIGVEITKTFLRHDAVVFILARQKPKKLIQAKGNKKPVRPAARFRPTVYMTEIVKFFKERLRAIR